MKPIAYIYCPKCGFGAFLDNDYSYKMLLNTNKERTVEKTIADREISYLKSCPGCEGNTCGALRLKEDGHTNEIISVRSAIYLYSEANS